MSKLKEIKDILNKDYGIIVNKKWVNKYIYQYSKFIPNNKKTMLEATEEILKDPYKLAYFIYGSRAFYVEKKYYKSCQLNTTVES